MSTNILFSRQKKYRKVRNKNTARIFRSTAIIMIVNELTGVIAVLIDGIMTSQGLGVDAYSGISLARPFTSIVLLIVGFLSTGCNIVCSRLIGSGKKEEANEAFNLSVLFSVACSAALILFCLCFPDKVLTLCGVKKSLYPELNYHFFGYLRGYLVGLPALMLIQVLGPIMVMDNGKRLFMFSSLLLCATDIIGDVLNIYVFHGGAFGMGLATSASYIVQVSILLFSFAKKGSYFRISPKACRLRAAKEIFRNGSPALIKKLAGTLRDISINYINIMVAVSAVAIAAKGIQNDVFMFLFCIPTGLGRTLLSMTAIYYSADDVQGLKNVLSFAVGFGARLSGIAAVIAFIGAPYLTKLYTSDPEVIALGVFSIRWMTVALVFDTFIVLIQHFYQGADNLKRANVLNVCERFVAPVLTALILGLLFGSRGVLASFGVSKIILLSVIFLYSCIYNHGIPKDWLQIMFLPEGFGGKQSDNMYAEIRTMEDAVQVSEETLQFCREHQTDEKKAYYASLCVEEMAGNVIKYAEKKGKKDICIDYRLFISEDDISISLRDISDQFDPTVFYQLHAEDEPTEHIGIRMVTRTAKDVRYFSTFRSNNLLINI